MINFTKEGRVGDKVKSMRCGKGTIIAINNRENETYPIVVAHDSGGQSTYTATGKHLETYSHSSLMFDNGSVTIDQGSPPEREDEELYCGLTKKQWQRVIEEEFLVGKSNGGVKSAVKDRSPLLLSNHDKTKPHPFLMVTKVAFKHVAIPNMKGIRKPHFGVACPTTHEGLIAVKLRCGEWTNINPANAPKVWIWRKGDRSRTDIMEYIELP